MRGLDFRNVAGRVGNGLAAGLAGAALSIGLIAAPASADVLLDTGPGALGPGWGLGRGQSLGLALTFDTGTMIESVRAFVAKIDSRDVATRSFSIALQSDEGGLPGTGLFARTASVGTSSLDVSTTAGGLGWRVDAGRYWLTFSSSDDLMMGGFAPNGVGSANEAFTEGGAWRATVFQQSLAVRVTGTRDPAAAVPEPASWAMMIAGFGLAGASMRRRRAGAPATA